MACLLLLFFLLRQFKGFAGVFPDRVDAHGAPAFLIDVVESDGLTFVERLLHRCTLTFGHVVRGDDVRMGGAACVAVFAVLLLEFEDDDALSEGSSKIVDVHDDKNFRAGNSIAL